MAHAWHHGRRAKQQRFGDLWWWYRQEPKWWRKLHKHVPRRAANAAMLDYPRVAWACTLYPTRNMPDEDIFPIPSKDLERIRMLERNLASP